MKRVEISEAVDKLADYVRRLDDEEPVAITDGDQVLAVLIATPNSDWESVSLSLNPKFQEILERADRQYWKEGGIPLDQVMEELGLTQADLDAVRVEWEAEEEAAPIRASGSPGRD